MSSQGHCFFWVEVEVLLFLKPGQFRRNQNRGCSYPDWFGELKPELIQPVLVSV